MSFGALTYLAGYLKFTQNRSISNDELECTIVKSFIEAIETDLSFAKFDVRNQKISNPQ